MNSLVKKALSTLKHDGVRVLLNRIWNYSIVFTKRRFSAQDTQNDNKWIKLKNRYKGKRIFILGNGPSLNETPLFLLKEEFTMCFNRFNLMFDRLDWKPSFYVVADDLVVKDMYKEINKEILPHVQLAFFPDLHPSNVNFKKLIEARDNVHWIYTDIPEFRSDLPNCGINKTVVNAGIQIAAYLGFTEIYLLGVDVSFTEQKVVKINSRNWEAADNDPNHFDPRYFEKGRKYHNPTTSEMIEKFQEAKEYFDPKGVKIFNAGVKGKLEVFPRIALESVLKTDEAAQEQLLSKSQILLEKKISFSELIATAKTYSPEDRGKSFFKATPAQATPLFSQLLNEYLVLGPYRNEYYFIKK